MERRARRPRLAVPRRRADPLAALMRDRALAWDGWAISKPLGRALWLRLDQCRPARILELGSGTSTVLLAAWAAQAGASLVTLEHDPDHHALTAAALARHGLSDAVALVLAPCRGQPVPFYDHPLAGPVDFVLVDGPPQDIGRQAVLDAIWPHLGPEWEVWLKDAGRAHEQACLAAWRQRHRFLCRIRQEDRRGVAVLTPVPEAPPARPRRLRPVPYRPAAPRAAPPASPPRFAECVPRTGSGRVTVSIPCFDCRDHLRRAVDSILRQSHDDLRLIVTSDGEAAPPWDVLDDIDDPRLVRFALPRNMGRYFVDDVVLSATPDDYYLIQDADDWSAPDRIARLLEALCRENAVAALSSGTRFDLKDGQVRRRGPERYATPNPQVGATYRHLARHHGLFRTGALRAMGGYYGGFRISFDMLVMNLMLMAGRLAYVDLPLYNRLVRPRSLTMSAETGMRSAARQAANRQLRALYGEVFRAYRRFQSGATDFDGFARQVRRITGRGVPREAAALREVEVARLRDLLAAQDAALAPRPASPRAPDLDDPALDWGGWSLSRAGAARLAAAVDARAPRAMVELGSGSTTALLAAHAARSGARLVSLEHDPAHYRATRHRLARLGLAHAVDLRLAPLIRRRPGGGEAGVVFDTVLEGPFDFALIDGPPMSEGREMTLPFLAPHLAPGWQVWLHDGLRGHEMGCLDRWRGALSFTARLDLADHRGFWILAEGSPARIPVPEARRIGISILTGRRPGLLARTVAALAASAPGLLEHAHVECLVNGGDAATLAATDRMRFIDARHVHRGAMWPIGQATSFLMRRMAAARVDMVLHLEDDWEAVALEDGWLGRAVAILDSVPAVGQVRLRHRDDRVLGHHEITRRPIAWTDGPGYRLSPAAHFTFNPSLVRRSLLPRLFPAGDEHAAQRAFLATGAGTAQLLPGVFRHIGQSDSLRRRRTREIA